MQRANENSVYFINMTQDLLHSKADRLYLHGKEVFFVNLPEGVDLSDIVSTHEGVGAKIDAVTANIKDHSKIYFSAHGNQRWPDAVFDKNHVAAKIFKIDQVADFFAHLLSSNPAFKDPNHKPRVTLILHVCEGLTFAKQLQKILYENYKLYIDVVANRFATQPQYSINPNDASEVNIDHMETERQSAAAEGRKQAHSKVLLIIDENGAQKEIDAYELKWINSVINYINQYAESITKWMVPEEENQKQLQPQRIKEMCKELNGVVGLFFETHGTQVVANKFFTILTNFMSEQSEMSYQTHSPGDSFMSYLNELIVQGAKLVNIKKEPSLTIKDELEFARRYKAPENLTFNEVKQIISEVKSGFSTPLSDDIFSLTVAKTQAKNTMKHI